MSEAPRSAGAGAIKEMVSPRRERDRWAENAARPQLVKESPRDRFEEVARMVTGSLLSNPGIVAFDSERTVAMVINITRGLLREIDEEFAG